MGEAADPSGAAPAGYVDAGSPPPVVYALPEATGYDMAGAGGAGTEQFGGGDGEQFGGGGGGADDQFSGMPLQVGWRGTWLGAGAGFHWFTFWSRGCSSQQPRLSTRLLASSLLQACLRIACSGDC